MQPNSMLSDKADRTFLEGRHIHLHTFGHHKSQQEKAKPFKKVAGDSVFTPASNTLSLQQQVFAPAHALILTSWERACSVSLE